MPNSRGSGGEPLCCNCADVEAWLEQGCHPQRPPASADSGSVTPQLPDRPMPGPLHQPAPASAAESVARCDIAPTWRHNQNEWAIALALLWRRQQQAKEVRGTAKTAWQRTGCAGLVERVARSAMSAVSVSKICAIFVLVVPGAVLTALVISDAGVLATSAIELARQHQGYLVLVSGR